MKICAIAVLVSLTMSVLLVPVRGVQQDSDEPRFHVRIETSRGAALREKLEADGYDVLGVDAERSTIDLAVTRAEWRALKSKGHAVKLVDQRPAAAGGFASAGASAAVPCPGPGRGSASHLQRPRWPRQPHARDCLHVPRNRAVS